MPGFSGISPYECLPDIPRNVCPYEFCPESRTEIKFYRIDLSKCIYIQRERGYTKCMCTNHTDWYIRFTILGFQFYIWFETYSYEVKEIFFKLFSS